MGKAKRQGRHAKQKPERERRRRPDRAGRDQTTRDQATRDQATRDQATRDQAERNQAERGQAERQQTSRNQAAPDHPVRYQTGPEQAARSAPVPAGQPQAAGTAGQPQAASTAGQTQPARTAGQPQVAGTAGPPASEHGGHTLSVAARAEQLVSDALQAEFDGDCDAFVRCAAQLAERPGARGWQRAVEWELVVSLVRAVTAGWRQGWQPAEVVREVGRQFGARHARMATDAAAMEMRGYARAAVDERWQAQLNALGAMAWWGSDDSYLEQWREREHLETSAAVTCALEVLFGLATLPRVGRLCPLPGTARAADPASRSQEGPADQRTLGRVRTLLTQAETTELPEKAEALTSRAQELLASRSMGEALLAAGQQPAAKNAACGRRLFVDSPYESAKAVLLDAVAAANQCRAVWHKDLGLSTVLGIPCDLDAVELIFNSLQVQAATAMGHADSRRGEAGSSRTRSFRQSFLTSYAQHMGERLDEAAGAAQRQAAAESSGSRLRPVLAARHRAVDDMLGRMFPELTEDHAA